MSTRKIAGVLLTIAVVIFALAMIYRWLERGGNFDLSEVSIRGIRSEDSSAVCEIIAPCFGKPVRTLNTDSLSTVFQALNWVKDVEISRVFPSGLEISIELQKIVFIYSNGVELYPLSSTGQCLPASFLTDTIPVVTATTLPDSVIVDRLVQWLADVNDNAPRDIRITERGISVFVSSGSSIILGWGSFTVKWHDFIHLASIVSIQNKWLEIDMRYPEQAVLRYPCNEQLTDGENS